MPVVSIITPAYRAEAFIARTVKSVVAQTFPDWEMIIISDDERDYQQCLQSCGVEDTRLRFISSGGIRTGIAHARNVGLAAATSRIIALLDADDLFHTQKLERLVPLVVTHGMCVSAMKYVRYDQDRMIPISVIGLTEGDKLLGPDSYMKVHYSANAMQVFDRLRVPITWREDLAAMEDIMFSMEAFDHLKAVFHLNTPMHEYVFTENSFSTAADAPARFLAAKQQMLAKMDKNIFEVKNPVAVASLRRYLELSIATEYEYAESMKRGEKITFSELFEKKLPLL
jgi:succinoglycan biosynthesis protein ExoO